MKNKIYGLVLVTILLLALVGCVNKKQNDKSDEAYATTTEALSEEKTRGHSLCKLDSVEQVDESHFIVSFEGTKHDFIIDFPEIVQGAPLVLMLHGYGESTQGFRQTVGFEKDANAMGYAVVYVAGAPSPEDATSAAGWNSGIGVSSNNDVDFLCAVVNYLCEAYAFDATRVYAVGFSNGAFMTHRLALEAADTFTAIVSVAGMMPESVWENKTTACEVGVFQITGEKDDVIPKNSDGSAQFSKAPAIEDVIDYYVKINELALAETADVGKKSTLTKYTAENSSKQVWHLFIPDGRHSWPSEATVGVYTNQLILEFLETQQ